MFDGKAFGEEMVGIVRGYVDRATAPLIERITELEARQLVRGEKGDAGERGEPGEAGPGPDMDAIERMLADLVAVQVAEAIAALPPAERGEKGDVGDRGEVGPGPDMEAVERSIADAVTARVAAAVAAIPPAERGEKGAPGEQGDPGQKGEDGQDGKDGAGIADLLIDREGALVATMTDGRMKSLGCVIGKDGRNGEDGKAGADGRDGIGPEDIDLELLEDDRTLRLTASRDGESKSFDIPFPIVLDRGDHEAEKSYAEADMVSRNGALWIARVATSSEPAEGSADWRCAVPKGQPGKDGYAGEARGLYDPAATYRAMDVVGFNGSEWRAKHDDPGELPGAGWMLSASKGKRGDKGDRGGDAGEGSALVTGYIDKQSGELILTKADGDEIKIDLRDIAGLFTS